MNGSDSESATRHQRPPFLVWFTGPPGAGKSTLAEALRDALVEEGQVVTLLDGDIIRQKLSADLGFSKADRDEQVRRVGALAREHLARGEIVLAALVSPYRVARDRVRASVPSEQFIEIHCDCPLEALIARDPKGMYALALAGKIQNFTGIDDPYEAPSAPEIHIRTDTESVEESCARLWSHLAAMRPGGEAAS